MNRKVFAASAAAFGFAPRVATAQAQPRPLQSVSVAIGGKTNIGYLPATLADALGYFRDEGLSVDISDFAGGTKALEALVGGSSSVMVGAYENTFPLLAKGIDVVAVASLTRSHGLAIAIQKKLAASYHSPKDLKGLKFGVSAPGSSTAVALDLFLAKGGLVPSDVAQIGIGLGAGAVAATKAGEVDGVVEGDPVLSLLLRDGDVVTIVDTRTERGQALLYGGDIVAGSILTTPSFAKQNPQVVQGVVNAIVRSLKFIHTKPVDQILAVVPPAFYSPDKDLYRRELDSFKAIFSTTGRIDPAAAATTLRTLTTSGPSKGQPIAIEKTFDNAFVQKANAKFR